MASRKVRPSKARPGKKAMPAPPKRDNSLTAINEKLERLESKIDQLRKQSAETEKDVEESLDSSQEVEEDVEGVGKDIERMEQDIGRLEEKLVRFGRVTVGREHFMEMARGTAGAFMGVGLGLGIRWIPDMARDLPWTNAIGILVFVIALGSLLIYKNEKAWIEKQGRVFVLKRLTHLFAISVCVEIIALVLFGTMPMELGAASKTLIVGLFPAISGAITFTIT